MARTVKLEKTASATSTMVTVYEDAVLSQQLLINTSKNIKTDGMFLLFDDCTDLDNLRITASNLHADTITLLSTPTDGYELLIAIATAKLFSSDIA